MKIIASPLTAALTGAWSALGLSAVGSLMDAKVIAPQNQQIAFLCAAVVFFFVPSWLCVIGVGRQSIGLRGLFSSEACREYGRVVGRMLCWFFSASLVGGFYAVSSNML